MNRLLRDPLGHFLVIGLMVFGLSFWFDGEAEDSSRLIRLTAWDLNGITQMWAKTHFRQPTEAELRGLLDSRIKEEILYREALALGLSEDDTIIRRRLAQKMEFLGEGLVDPGEPSEAELENYLAKNREQFQEPARVTYEHVYLNPEQRGVRLEQDARALLVSFQAGKDTGDVRMAGDPILLETRFDRVSQTSIANTFGKEFAEAVALLPQGQWEGPIRSAYGLHLVYVHERVESRLPDLNAIRDRVRLGYLRDRRRESKNTFYETLRSRYEVVVEFPQSQVQ